MQKFKLFFVGCGFFWIFLWSVFGSLLGAKINLLIVTNQNSTWFGSLEQSLLTAAHAHMNSMSITLILMGLSMTYLQGLFSTKIIKIVSATNLISIPVFGLSMMMEAFHPPVVNAFSPWTFLVALGGILYMMTMAIWSGFFFLASFQKIK